MFVKVTFTGAQVQELRNWQPGKEVSHNGELHLIICSTFITGGTICYTLEPVTDNEAPLPSLEGTIWKKWADR